MERIRFKNPLIAKNIDYKVYRCVWNDQYVLKIPTAIKLLSSWPHDPVCKAKRELAEAESRITGSDLKIPRTVIHKAKFSFMGFPVRGYILRQKII